MAMIDPQFELLFKRFLESKNQPSLDWEGISPPPKGAIIDYNDLTPPETAKVKDMLNKLVIIKLNGGLGTSMGCTGPKSVIRVRNDTTFLDLTVQRVEQLNKEHGCDVPLVLMNSFNTHEDTIKSIKKYDKRQVKLYTFLQSKYPRINKDTLMPEPDEFYPPGHGDFYDAFYNSGLLTKFIEEGREFCFVSNIDNLGASADLQILRSLTSNGKCHNFVMEVTDKTMADVKGGTLVNYQDKLTLLEIAQVPKDHIDEFKSVKKFRIFNTNNLWMKLTTIRELIEAKKLELDIIVNPKHLSTGVDVIQLETAAGAAMKYFDAAIGINVPRRRFLPVKKTSDLLLIMSNLYNMENGKVSMSPLRAFPSVPLVKLGDQHFSKVREFLTRFASIPDLLELNHLTVSGDVTFGKNVSLRGTVIIIANHGERIDIPSGSILENKIVSGNLRIMDH